MKCPTCQGSEGAYREVEDFNPGSEYEWSYYDMWQCLNKDCYDVSA